MSQRPQLLRQSVITGWVNVYFLYPGFEALNKNTVSERINNKHENHTHSSNSLSHGAIL